MFSKLILQYGLLHMFHNNQKENTKYNSLLPFFFSFDNVSVRLHLISSALVAETLKHMPKTVNKSEIEIQYMNTSNIYILLHDTK